jgi:hypothetical protein
MPAVASCASVLGRLLACSALAACGRIDFDPRDANVHEDAAIASGHDEDRDSIDDSLDPCPHDPTPTADGDGDGVGDACDPNPTLGTEHWIVFATMEPGNIGFDSIGDTTQEADALHFAGDSLDLHVTRALGTVRIQVGFEIRALFGVAQHQVAFGIDRDGAEPYYFTELNENAPLQDFAVISYDAANLYQFLDSTPTLGMHAGRGFVRADAIATGAPELRGQGGWLGELYSAVAPTPAYAGGTAIRMGVNGLDIDLEYLAIIATF